MIPVLLFNALIPSEAAVAAAAPIPIFLKIGFSTALDFDSVPSRVVIGDGGSFQLERLDKSLVIRPVVEEAITNLLVYFKNQPTRMFVLKASPEDEPALYRKYEGPGSIPAIKPTQRAVQKARGTRILSARFDIHKDFLTLEAEFVAPSTGALTPEWGKVSLRSFGKELRPRKLWAERAEIQADSRGRARFEFVRPDVSASLVGTTLVIPVRGAKAPLVLKVRGLK